MGLLRPCNGSVKELLRELRAIAIGMLRQCYRRGTGGLRHCLGMRECCENATELFLDCDENITGMLWHCYGSNTGVLRGMRRECYGTAIRECYGSSVRLLRECYTRLSF